MATKAEDVYVNMAQLSFHRMFFLAIIASAVQSLYGEQLVGYLVAVLVWLHQNFIDLLGLAH